MGVGGGGVVVGWVGRRGAGMQMHGRSMAGGMHGWGICGGGGMHGRVGMHGREGMCGRGCAWQGGCMAGEGGGAAWQARKMTTAADRTHPNGMHSCFKYKQTKMPKLPTLCITEKLEYTFFNKNLPKTECFE